MATASSG
jgi:ribosomal protein L19E